MQHVLLVLMSLAYPVLVTLEAGLHGVPLVTFESGGAADFARRGGGIALKAQRIHAPAQPLVAIAVK